MVKWLLKKNELGNAANTGDRCTYDILQLKIKIILPNLFAAASWVISNNCLPYFSKLALVTPTIFNISSSVSGKEWDISWIAWKVYNILKLNS